MSVGRTSSKPKPWMSSDKMLGVAGSGLAAASLGFGLYMNLHGPERGLGHSGDFTVFAQLAPRRTPVGQPKASFAATTDDSLDTTATASIPNAAADVAAQTGATAENGIIPSMSLQDVGSDMARIVVGGRIQTVRIGDDVPGAGEVLEIRNGPRALVRTSHGLIVAPHSD